MLYLIAALIAVLAFMAGAIGGHLLRIANALEAQNEHYGIGEKDAVEAAEEEQSESRRY